MSAQARDVRPGALARRLGEEPPLIGTFSILDDSVAAQSLARSGFDFVLVDLQHGLSDLSRMVPLLQGIEAGGAIPLVRVPSLSPTEIGTALDRGAHGVVVPMIESSAQAAASVAACRYPPAGERSYGPYLVRTDGFSDAAPPPCFVMVESAAALAAIDEIVAVPGLFGVYVGPSDLAISLGLGADYDVADPRHDDAVAAIGTACRSAGVVSAIHTSSAAEAQHRIAQGFTMVSVRSDLALLGSAGTVLLASTTLHP
ncbi:HpcH/HpaI aldolase family protein [Angustibacter luteus]|uniref:HpcH/HpaI aldolase/citrate lyase family protein n=1 Tax=Angustibacter luteus TaxID=658456 RepID=A0ABW1JFK7_9ACTN